MEPTVLRSYRLALLIASLAAPLAAGAQTCVPVGAWVVPGKPERVAAAEVLDRAAKQQVVLLGETHDSADDHRWQLQALAALHVRRPDMVIAFEMFPRRVQRALDRWVAGELTEGEFLNASEWRTVWSIDPQLYLPIFHFARMNRIPMVAANVSRDVVRAVGQKGLDAVPESEREGVGTPARPGDRYLDSLADTFAQHQPEGKRQRPARDDAEFRRFVDAQLLWDRAMAEAIAAAAKRSTPAPLVVGVMGRGHMERGDGVPFQLKALGVPDVGVLMAWDRSADCEALVAGLADAVFGVSEKKAPALARPRLGIVLETQPDGVRIQRVEKGSIAEAAGLREADVVTEIAGRPVKQAADVAETVQRQAPGTLLPIRVRRQGESLEIIARFPPRAD